VPDIKGQALFIERLFRRSEQAMTQAAGNQRHPRGSRQISEIRQIKDRVTEFPTAKSWAQRLSRCTIS
jgi:hypothetical protein